MQGRNLRSSLPIKKLIMEKKFYVTPEENVIELNLQSCILAGSDPEIPGEEGGENSGKEYTSDEGLDDILG